MIYTIFFYIIIIYIVSKRKEAQLKKSCVVVSLYYGVRYNYMPDYESYHMMYEIFSNPNYIYVSEYEHMEIGWFYLNKLFAPLGNPYGFFVFVFACSIVFAYGVYRVIKVYDFDYSYLPIIMFGYFTAPTTAVLCSAQRQFFVTGIFFIAYSFLVYDKIKCFRDLWSKSLLLYYGIVFLVTLIHSSAIVLLIVPVAYFFPSKSRKAFILVLLLFVIFILFAGKYLPFLMQGYIDKTGTYEYLEKDIEGGVAKSITITAMISYVIQIYFCAYALSMRKLDRDEVFAIAIAIICLLLALSGFYVPQINRIALYLNLFIYISMAILVLKLPNKMGKKYSIMMWGFIVWNALKVLQPMPLSQGRDVSYKTIFEVLF